MKKKLLTAVAAGIMILPALFGKSIMKTGIDKEGRSYEYAEKDPFNVRIYRLSNGMKVFLSANPAEPSVNLMTVVKAGSMDEPEHSTGLAHYFEHMMFKGSDKMGSLDWKKEEPLIRKLEELFEERRNTSDSGRQAEIYRKIDQISAEAAQYASPGEFSKLAYSLGASDLNAATSYSYTNYVVTVPSVELEKYLSLEAERFRNPVLRLFHTELETVYEEFNRGQDNDYRKSLDAGLKLLFPDHPVGRSVIGLPEHIKFPSMKDTMAFYRKFYVPSNMALIMTGDLDYEKTIAVCEKTLGTLPSQPEPEHKIHSSEPLKSSQTVSVNGVDAEHLRIFHKIPSTPRNRKLVNILCSLLADNGYGIMEQNLLRSRKILNAAAFSFELRDQIIFMFAGSPKTGQTLEQAADLLKEELKKVERGEFEDWRIPAVAENFRVRMAELKSGTNSDLNDELAELFLSGNESYADFLNVPDFAEKVTKQQISGFIREYLRHSVTVYKRSGQPEKIIKVEKPVITPVKLKSGENSRYADEFFKLPSGKLTPEHLVEQRVLSRKKMNSGRNFIKINKDYDNGLFHLRLCSPRGKFHDNRIEPALGYLEFLGTDRYSASALRQEFYKLGMKMQMDSSTYFTILEISGPEGRYEDAVDLLNHFLRNLKHDQKALKDYTSLLLKDRKDTKKNPFQNFLHTAYYAWYGADNPFVNVLTEEELRKITASELTGLLQQIFSETSTEMIYSGSLSAEEAAKAVEKLPVIQGKPVPKRRFYPVRRPEKPTIWYVEYEKVQLSIGLVSSGEPFSAEDMAFEELINEYFFQGLDAIVFQEIRESRALAYSAGGSYFLQKEKGYSARSYLLVETQPDKALEAVQAATELLQNMPFYPVKFQAAKQSVLKKLASERKLSFEVYNFFRTIRRAGLKKDWRSDLYERIKGMSESEFRKMAKEKLSRPYDIVIVGKPGKELLKKLSGIGTVRKLKQEEIFGH